LRYYPPAFLKTPVFAVPLLRSVSLLSYRGFVVPVQISDFTETDLQLVSVLLQERYGKPVAPEAADSELRLDPASEELTLCPTLYWHERGAHFVVCKLPQGLYRCQFFYSDADHYGTGRETYDDLRDCVLTVLRVQSDHERQSASVSSGITATIQTPGADAEEYQGPLVI
jgi:hypothetical protein